MDGIMRGLVISTAVASALVLAAVGCGPEESGPDPARFSVRLATSLPISGRWERDAERGLGRIAAELDADVARLRTGSEGGSRALLAEQGSSRIDVIFCVGSGFEKTIYSEAARYPDSVFVMLPGRTHGANVAAIDFVTEGAGYLAGVVAGVVAEHDRVGLLRGDGRPWLESLEEGFVGGLKSGRRKASVVPADGVEGAVELAGDGIGVAFYSSDRADPEVVAAAREGGLRLIVTDPQLAVEHPEVVVAVIDVDVAEAMVRVAREVRDGTFVGRVFAFDLGSGVVDVILLGGLDPEVAERVKVALDEARSEVTAGLVEFDELGLLQ